VEIVHPKESPDEDPMMSIGMDHWQQNFVPEFKRILDKFENRRPHLWITGHSLGAGIATIFTSVLLWKRTSMGCNSPVKNLDWDSVSFLSCEP